MPPTLRHKASRHGLPDQCVTTKNSAECSVFGDSQWLVVEHLSRRAASGEIPDAAVDARRTPLACHRFFRAHQQVPFQQSGDGLSIHSPEADQTIGIDF